jgi:catechol 2,3-dioxygenase-like lactoylglutathione lyase family enzyme
MAAVRYLVKDVDRSIAFYTGRLGFTPDHHLRARCD